MEHNIILFKSGCIFFSFGPNYCQRRTLVCVHIDLKVEYELSEDGTLTDYLAVKTGISFL